MLGASSSSEDDDEFCNVENDNNSDVRNRHLVYLLLIKNEILDQCAASSNTRQGKSNELLQPSAINKPQKPESSSRFTMFFRLYESSKFDKTQRNLKHSTTGRFFNQRFLSEQCCTGYRFFIPNILFQNSVYPKNVNYP